MRGTALHDRIVLAGAALFACAHLLWLPGHLEDIDSINFTLGVLDYEVAAHQPHPPGYPVLMLLAKAIAWLLTPLVGEPLPRATLALAVLSSLAGAVALVALYHALRLAVGVGGTNAGRRTPNVERRTQDVERAAEDVVGGSPGVAVGDGGTNAERRTTNADRRTQGVERGTEDVVGVSPGVAVGLGRRSREAWLPLTATALAAASPLFWITAARPLSDMPGLAGALVCQWLLLRAAQSSAAISSAYVAAAACGVAVGLRSQVTWLVAPLLVWMWWRVWQPSSPIHRLGVAIAALLGVLTWAVPMVVLTGGVQGYRAALSAQAGEDFDGVPMLFMQPGLRRLLTTLIDSFVTPWAWWPLVALVSALALVGLLLVVMRRVPLRLAWLTLGFAPYLVFHLLFQETETTRYALPLVVPVAVLATAACAALPGVLAHGLAALVVVASLGVSVQAHRQYVSAGMTVGEVLADMQAAAHATPERPLVLMHRRVWAETRRARSVVGTPAYDVPAVPRALEWQLALPIWAQGTTPVWWLVDPRRGDRAAVDPRALSLRRRVSWPEPVASVLGGMRPHAFDWYDVPSPQWVLQRGWGLTPELAGLAAAAGEGPGTTGATAAVRAFPGGGTLVIGGRRVASAGAAPADLDVRLGDTWTHREAVAAGNFVMVVDAPALSLPGGYLPLRVTVPSSAEGRILLEQFDAQPRGVPVLALESGWYEPERDISTGRMWRWVGDQSTLRIANASGDVRLVVEGTWPRHYDTTPVLEILAGDRPIARHELARPFRVEQRITAELLRAHGGRVSWRVAPSFVAGERTGTADARRLALEIASLRVEALR